MCLEHQSHGSLGPSGKLAAVIKFDIRGGMDGGKAGGRHEGEQRLSVSELGRQRR